MASKPMRLTDYAEATALKYGKTVSEGIKEMEFRLDHNSLQSATMLQNTTQDVAFGNWEEFEDHVIRALSKAGIHSKIESIKPATGSGNTFSPANTKIDGCEIKSAIVNGVEHQFIMHPTKGRLPVKNGKIAL
jgi:hypothetical protein